MIYIGGIRGCSEIFLCCFRDQDRVRVCSGPVRLCEQGFLDDHQVGQGEQRVQLCGVLLETAIAQLLVAEQSLPRRRPGFLTMWNGCSTTARTRSTSSRTPASRIRKAQA